ncbi:MAG: hypothetical protein DRJ08_05770 [Acidobacteria bacterium]|nr:MAG: hypothetical protein DRJ14_06685 [Acidobacteriota bacterium]RLE21318.1 MAG: hypothetical protein DRJ08_05770 [Acidobacteriota bacterium]
MKVIKARVNYGSLADEKPIKQRLQIHGDVFGLRVAGCFSRFHGDDCIVEKRGDGASSRNSKKHFLCPD